MRKVLHIGVVFVGLLTSNISVGEARKLEPTEQEWLDSHNKARASKGVRPLQWDTDLAKIAKQRLEIQKKSCKMYHVDNAYGENLAAHYGYGDKDIPVSDSVRLWLLEEKKYKPSGKRWCNPKNSCLHYTQVMWSATRRLGCAEVKCTTGPVDHRVLHRIRGCIYDPRGNWRGRKVF